MMKYILIILIVLTSCNLTKSKSTSKFFEEIDYTFDNGFNEAFSLKINSDGTCIVGEGRWTMKFYTSQLSKIEIESIDSLLQITPLNQYDSCYREPLVDQASYCFVLINRKKETIKKFVYGESAPKLLNQFSDKLEKIKKNLNLIGKDTTTVFLSRINFFPPPLKATH